MLKYSYRQAGEMA